MQVRKLELQVCSFNKESVLNKGFISADSVIYKE